MSKAVMISIRPKWCEKICSGKKAIEVRKTRPKMETPFKCYIYCTVGMAGYDALWVLDASTREKYSLLAVSAYLENPKGANKGNGKVIGEFTCEDIYEMKIYDTPKDLSKFSRPFENCIDKVCDEFGCALCENGGHIKRPPQSWCYVEEQK